MEIQINTSMVDFKNKLALLKSNTTYRLGDVFLRAGNRWKQDRHTILTGTKYDGTILKEYLLNKTHERDYTTLKNVINQIGDEKQYLQPDKNELVVHLRTGDSMDTEIKYNNSARIPDLTDKINQIKRVISATTENNQIEKITAVTALHFGNEAATGLFQYSDEIYTRNIEFLEGFIKNINDIGFELNIMSNSEIDRDIYYMARSKHYLPSISNISKIISKCVDEKCEVYNYQ